MLNKVILQGNIGRDPKVILMQDGKEIIIFPLATSQQWKDESGEWHSRADWHSITVSRKSTLKWIKDILKQGDPIYVEGKLCYRSKKDKFGHSHSTAHIVVSEKEGCVKCLRPTSSLSSSLGADPNAVSKKTASSQKVRPFPGEREPHDLHQLSKETSQPLSNSWQKKENLK